VDRAAWKPNGAKSIVAGVACSHELYFSAVPILVGPPDPRIEAVFKSLGASYPPELSPTSVETWRMEVQPETAAPKWIDEYKSQRATSPCLGANAGVGPHSVRLLDDVLLDQGSPSRVPGSKPFIWWKERRVLTERLRQPGRQDFGPS